MEKMEQFRVNVLFIPFDAARQHYKRNAKGGVLGNRIGEERSLVCEPGTAMTLQQIEQHLEDIIKESIPIGEVGFRQPLPHVVFLSEQPKDVKFPTEFTVHTTSRANKNINNVYKSLGHTGKLPTQKIYAYMWQSPGDCWQATASPLTWTDRKFGNDQHVLMVEFTPPDKAEPYRVAGVHLTSQNTSLRTDDKMKEAFTDLIGHCEHDNIHAVIGDFNMDTSVIAEFNINNSSGRSGYGSMVGKDVWVVPNDERSNDLRSQKQSSASTGMIQYMGWITISPVSIDGVGSHQRQGMSMKRCLGQGQNTKPLYFSDHPPLFISIRRDSVARRAPPPMISQQHKITRKL